MTLGEVREHPLPSTCMGVPLLSYYQTINDTYNCQQIHRGEGVIVPSYRFLSIKDVGLVIVESHCAVFIVERDIRLSSNLPIKITERRDNISTVIHV